MLWNSVFCTWQDYWTHDLTAAVAPAPEQVPYHSSLDRGGAYQVPAMVDVSL